MAAALTHPAVRATGWPGRRFDHIFFSAMAVILLGTVFLGFARSYYLAGVFHAPLPSLIVHIHGAAFTCWILLFVAQTSLVLAGRVDLHRRLGIAGFLLAGLMVVLGALVATDSLVRHTAQPVNFDARAFYIVPLTDLVVFAVLVFFGFRERRNPAAHKRLMMIATIGISDAAIARWPLAFVSGGRYLRVQLALLALLAIYDLWSTRKLNRITLWAGGLLIVLELLRAPVGNTHAWHSFANWVISAVH
ncbi:MAG: hypothetical protein ABSG16_14740 [Candidatus Acidiferrum sp.]|jgi:FtsH-binding integral membrane protein